MKNTLKTIVVMASIAPLSLFSQSWDLGGNNGVPPNPVNNTNNTLGTLNNIPLKIATNGIQRMQINGTNTQNVGVDTTNTDGYVGIGNY